ncbi:MAG: DUF697 domain-containing protein [Planctomycetales bacterium]|nr:DUF697 domain-containing protein [Planctomycetales bacterium]
MFKTNSKLNRIATFAVLAFVGALLIYLPTVAYNQYKAAKDLGPTWGTLYLVLVGTGALILLGLSVWTFWKVARNSLRKRSKRAKQSRNPSQMSLADRKAEVSENLAEVENLPDDPNVTTELREELRPMLKLIEEKQEQKKLEIVAFGTISSGKSSLMNALAGRDVFETSLRGGTTVERSEIPWPGMDSVHLVDTPGLSEVDGSYRANTASEAAKDADIVLVVVDGPLRDSEHTLLKRLGDMEKRVIVCLNKDDWFTPRDRDALLGQIAGQVSDFVQAKDIVSVRSRPTERERIRVASDGTQSTEMVEVPPDISPLADRMAAIVKRDGQDLLLANLLLQSRGLVDEAKERVRERLDIRAWRLVDKYTWVSGGAAALNPIPLADLAAGVAISSKMVIDLARVYHQDIDVKTVTQLLGHQGKNVIGFGGAIAGTYSIQWLATAIKAAPGIGTVTGGALQGIIQAVITRWIGAIFIEYFKNEMCMPSGGMAALARDQWERVTSVNELRKLVMSARSEIRDAQ